MDDIITFTVTVVVIVGVGVILRAITAKPKPKHQWFEVGSSDVMNVHRKAKKEKEKS